MVYRALTKIRLRKEPDIDSPSLQEGDWVGFLEAGDCFEVKGIVTDGRGTWQGQKYLKLFAEDGWAFTLGTAGKWAYQPIVEQVPKEELTNARASALAGVAKRKAARLAEQAKSSAAGFANWGAKLFGQKEQFNQAKTEEQLDNERREALYKTKVEQIRNRQQKEVEKDLDGLF